MVMDLFLSLDEKILEKEKKSKELEIQVASLIEEIHAFNSSIAPEITPKKLSTYLNNRENFSDEQWQYIQSEKEKWSEKQRKELSSIRDPRQTAEKRRSSGAIALHWIPI